MTNRDKINKMSNEELAELITNNEKLCWGCIGYLDKKKMCKECIKEWLESEVE